jgi:Ca2+-binding EF-hand superfamily protein
MGQMDPNQIFNFMAGGKDVWVRSEITDPRQQMAFDRTAERMGVTNGQITREQYVAYMTERMALRGVAAGAAGPGGPAAPGQSPSGGDWVETLFRRLDRNGDNQLNSDEMPPQLRAELSRWDTNKDGLISLDEFREYMKNTVQQWQAGGGNWGQGPNWNSGGDQPGDDEEEKKPVVYKGGNLPKELPPWFAQYDTDKDGQIGLYEWKATGRSIEEFQKYDRNGDGFLTVEEVLRVEAPNKPAASTGQQVANVPRGQGGFGAMRLNWGGQQGGGAWGGQPGRGWGGPPGGGWGGQPGGGWGGQPGGGWGGQPGGGWGGQPGGGGPRGNWGGTPGGGQGDPNGGGRGGRGGRNRGGMGGDQTPPRQPR